MGRDKVSAAIAAVETPTESPAWQGRIVLPSSGRSAVLRVPVDMTAGELLDLMGYLATQLAKDIARTNAPTRLLVPQH